MNVTEAVENYLETILVLSKQKEGVHAIDICAELGFSRPTVSEMIKQLKTNELIVVDELNHISLTPKGEEIATAIYERHVVIMKMLMMIGVERSVAYKDACKIEHDISDETFECFKKHASKYTTDKKQ